ncbi:hypothetical protein D3C76_714430 [compost metagenome]
MPFGKLLVRRRLEAGIGHRPQQQLEAQGRGAGLFGLQRHDRRHVAADAVAGHGQALAVHTDLFAMLGHPLGRGVGLVDCSGVVRFR